MDIVAFAKEVHENAKVHGWWDTECSLDEITALIHSEWSEALEEFRAGRPMVWYNCDEVSPDIINPCTPQDAYDCLNYGKKDTCKYRSKKPEGIAIELVDGVLRILDYLTHIKFDNELLAFDSDEDFKKIIEKNEDITLPSLVCLLHRQTANSFQDPYWLVLAMRYVFVWIKENGLDPETIIREKHAYNVTRPYRHGGKVC